MSFKYKFKNLIFIIFQLIFFNCFLVYNSFADDKFFKENLGEDLFKESSSNDDLLNDEDIKKVLGGASYEAKQSWKNVPQDKLQCIKIGLKINNTSLDNLISEGIGPSDNKMSSYNKICSDILNQKLRFNISCKLNDEQGKSYYSKCNESLITIKNDKIVKLTKLEAMKVMFNGGEVRTYKEITKEAAKKRQQKIVQKTIKEKSNNNMPKKTSKNLSTVNRSKKLVLQNGYIYKKRYSDGSCNEGYKEVCLDNIQFKRLCNVAKGLTIGGRKTAAMMASPRDFKQWLESGGSTTPPRTAFSNNTCRVNYYVYGLLRGTDRKELVSGKVSQFVVDNNGTVLMHQIFQY